MDAIRMESREIEVNALFKINRPSLKPYNREITMSSKSKELI